MGGVLTDEELLLGILNSTPVVDGTPTDEFADRGPARAWLAGAGGTGTEAELREVLKVRRSLQAVVRGEVSPEVLASALQGVTLLPAIVGGRITWALGVSPERRLAVRAVLTWDALAEQRAGRLRPCANHECHLFLIDRSRANSARWCSMAVCGNRMKARRHYERAKAHPD
jgi:predicted RNA-binding Zn ribbon-like protein